jgi:hypothetical protein
MKKKILCILTVFSLFLLVAPSANAAWDFYLVQLYEISPNSDGLVRIKFTPGTDEDAFTGIARAHIDQTDPGASKMLATLLTAASMGWQCSLYLQYVPSFEFQKIVQINLSIPTQ